MKTTPSTVQDAIQYARNCAEGKIVASAYVKKQCLSFLDDLETRQHSEDFRWYFDQHAASHVLTFCQLLQRFDESENKHKPFILEPWQAFFLISLYGWRDKANNLIRRYTSAILLVGRKNGKSTLIGALALYELRFAPEQTQIVTLATTQKQAGIVWGMSVKMMNDSDKRLTKGFIKRTNNLSNPEKWSSYIPLPRESKSLDGLNIRLAIFDEAAAITDPNLFEVVTSSMGNQLSPLTVMITTGQPGAQSNFFYEELDYAKKVLDGIIDDTRTFALCYQIDEGDDWKDPQNWIKSNPNLGVSAREERLQDELNKALEVPSRAGTFRTKYLNEFISTASSWIELEKWQKNTIPVLDEKMPLYVGVDLSLKDDLTAVSLVFSGEGQFHFTAKCFVPEETFKNIPKHVRQVYNEALESGTLIVTPGDIIDPDSVIDYIKSLAEKYDLREVAFDPYGAGNISKKIIDSGLNVITFGQGWLSMSPSVKDTEIYISNGSLKHLGDKFLTWQLSNCVSITDTKDNIKVEKGDDKALKIDAIIAMIMAVGRATALGGSEKVKTFDFYIA